MLAFNYFFLPPVGKFTVADPQNWVALLAFLAVAVIASHLSTRARQQAADASARQHDIEKLYAFSQGLLESRNVMELVNRIPAQIVRCLRSRRGRALSGRQAKGLSLRTRGAATRYRKPESHHGARRAGD